MNEPASMNYQCGVTHYHSLIVDEKSMVMGVIEPSLTVSYVLLPG